MVKRFILLLLFLVYGQSYGADFKVYGLFGNSVYAVFPGQPVEQDLSMLPDFMKAQNIRMFLSIDQKNQVVYSFRARDFEQDKEIGAYNKTIKEMLDSMYKLSFNADGFKLVDYKSDFSRKANRYENEHHSFSYEDGTKIFRSGRVIIQKRKVYEWNVLYKLQNQRESHYENYKKYFRVDN